MNEQGRPSDPYNLLEVLAKIASYSWNKLDENGNLKHRQEFLDKGIRSETELRETLTKGVDSKNTRAFREEPNRQMGQTVSRELYGIQCRDAKGDSFELVLVVNPNLSKEGRMFNGTCFVPEKPGLPEKTEYLDKALNNEVDRQRKVDHTIKREDLLVTGGRPALGEQDSHRQIVEPQNTQEQRRPGAAQQRQVALPTLSLADQILAEQREKRQQEAERRARPSPEQSRPPATRELEQAAPPARPMSLADQILAEQRENRQREAERRASLTQDQRQAEDRAKQQQRDRENELGYDR